MICLSFDIEEFDTPREYGSPIPEKKQVEISLRGTERILETLMGFGVRATFFCTANFARQRPDIVRRIVREGHEVASHSYYHSKFETSHLLESRLELERITGQTIHGYRSPRMYGADHDELLRAGYTYDSSLNPTYLPGRYNNRKEPRSIFRTAEGIVEIPASVSSPGRLPLFWLSLHNMPLGMYLWLCQGAIRRDGYLNVYFHPWEFVDSIYNPDYKLPFYIRRNAGERLACRLGRVIDHFKNRNETFGTLTDLIKQTTL